MTALPLLQPGRSQENIIVSRKREHSRKPDEQYKIIESCSPGPYLEMFARGPREGWTVWGNQAEEYEPTWETYKNHSQANKNTKEKLKSGNTKEIVAAPEDSLS